MIGTGNGVSFPEDEPDSTFGRLRRGVIEGTIADEAGTWLIACSSDLL